jgi:7-keto-8-aminopelargonate synthetase-like enzyme/predicted N-acyltransferase
VSAEPRHEAVDTLNQMVVDMVNRGLGHHVATDERLDGRLVTVHDREMVNFGSCSYLGLERHPKLIAAAHEALDRFGTQFSSSRAFLALQKYEELEALLREMYGKPVLVSATTTLGHLATLPVIVRDGDAVILDMQVHSSVQMAAQLLKARGTPLYILRHNSMEDLERRVKSLKARYRKVWYFADGIYSMYGDAAPMAALTRLLDTYEQLHVYIDDAHGMSWAGPHGIGYVRREAPHHPRMVLAVSLNKAFACAGGAVVLPEQETADRIRNCGSTQLFSGPIQPAMLGAAVASAKLHLSDEMPGLQAELAALVAHTNRRLSEVGLPQVEACDSPVFFVPLGLPRLCANLCERMLKEGMHVHMGTFPATPMRAGGVRFCIHRNVTTGDIDKLVERLRYHYPRVLDEEGSSCAEVAKVFGLPEFSIEARESAPPSRRAAPALTVTHHGSIREIDQATWDGMFEDRGNYSHAGLMLLEDVFGKGEAPEEKWTFHYMIVQDPTGHTVLATFFTEALVKDDMFAPDDVSRALEEQRAHDPYYLTSRAILLGTLMTPGAHLYLDRAHAGWKDALALLAGRIGEVADASHATRIYLREFETGADPELRTAMLDLGYIEVKLPDVCVVENADWKDHEGFMARLGSRYRNDLRREVLKYLDEFELVTEKPTSPEEILDAYDLYVNVFEKAFELNVFRLPYAFFEAMSHSPSYDVLRLVRRGDPEKKPVAVMWSHAGKERYNALIIGLDYEAVASHDVYKQMLYRTVIRARELGARTIDLAFTAVLAKKKVGARPHPRCAYVQIADHYSEVLMDAMAGASSRAPRG